MTDWNGVHISSTVAVAKNSCMTAKVIAKLVMRLAAWLVLYQRSRQSASRELVHFFDVGAHAETPLSVGVHNRLFSSVGGIGVLCWRRQPTAERGRANAIRGTILEIQRPGVFEREGFRDNKNIIPSHHERVLVCKSDSAKMLTIRSRLICPMGLVERTTKCATRAHQLKIAPPAGCGAFQHATRVVCTDRGQRMQDAIAHFSARSISQRLIPPIRCNRPWTYASSSRHPAAAPRCCASGVANVQRSRVV